jgi:hypothetical protein
MKMTQIIRDSVITGGKAGVKTGFSLLAIMIPISFGVALLQWFGILDIVSNFISPLFKHMGLPGSAAFAFLTGALVNEYTAIAVMVTLPLTLKEVTILSLMILFAHSLPVEVSVQKKAGSSALLIVLLRVGAAVVAGYVLNWIMPASGLLAAQQAGKALNQQVGFLDMLGQWTSGSLFLIMEVMLVVIGLMILNAFLEKSGFVTRISRWINPVIRILGLSRNSSFLWIVSNTLGLAYGAGVILAQRREKKISDKDIRELNVSMATCHSMFEDTFIFAAIGAAVPWIVIPRFIAAGLSVWCYRLIIHNRKG